MSVQPYIPGLECAERRLDLSQWYSPPELAQRLWDWAMPPASRPLRVLEPAAGQGALLRPMFGTTRPKPLEIVVYDVDPRNTAALRELLKANHSRYEVREHDFTADPNPGLFDLVVLNPPYEGGQDVEFVNRALAVAPRVVGIFRSDIQHSSGRWDFWRNVQLRRKVVLRDRPKFGGDSTPMSDFVVLEFGRRRVPIEVGEPITVGMEWW